MHVVALCSHKGGSGKTTLAGHLAVQAELAGAGPVGLADSDPLGTLSAWWTARQSAPPAFVATTLARLSADLERLRLEGCKLVIIDTPPAINVAIQRVLDFAELAIVPVRPSPHDLQAVTGTVDMVERANCRLVFVLNAVNLRAEITSDTVVILSERGTVAPVLIQHRTDLATSMTDGRTVCELEPEGHAAKEIGGLWDYLAAQLQKQERRRVFQQPATLGFGRRAGL
jgi:chromosome partitioning protein